MSNKNPEDRPSNVVPFAAPAHREPPPTAAEIAEYRRLRPALLQMLEEWQKVRIGCPIARRTISD